MTIKRLTHAHPAGYTLSQAYTGVDIWATGSVGGTGLSVGFFATIQNHGVIDATSGNGVSLSAGGVITNGSATDTTALIEGVNGVYELTKSTTTLSNFGTITGVGPKVDIGVIIYNGRVTNGSANDTTALIESVHSSALILNGSSCAASNFGTISAPQSDGMVLETGSLTNGSREDSAALIEGETGVFGSSEGGPSVFNFGTISGSRYGIYLTKGGLITNGSAIDTAALIEGPVGLQAGGEPAVISNFGTIDGEVFVRAGGTVTNGSARDRAALIEGEISAGARSEALTICNWGTIARTGGLALHFFSRANVLEVEARSVIEGAVDGGGGTLDLASGTGAISAVSGGDITVSGSIARRAFSNFGTLEIGAGSRFTLYGATTIGPGGTTSLIDDGALVVAGSLTVTGALTIGAGASLSAAGAPHSPAIVLVGLLQNSAGTGVSSVGVMVTDNGTIEATTNTLSFTAAVQGRGILRIEAGAALQLAGAVANSLMANFDGSASTLALGDASLFAATIAGFASGDTLDLVDTAATGATVNGADQLVITDGSATIATLQLTGNYAGATFTATSDGAGGTAITISNGSARGPVHGFVSAAAAMTRGVGLDDSSAARPEDSHRIMLASPRLALA